MSEPAKRPEFPVGYSYRCVRCNLLIRPSAGEWRLFDDAPHCLECWHVLAGERASKDDGCGTARPGQ